MQSFTTRAMCVLLAALFTHSVLAQDNSSRITNQFGKPVFEVLAQERPVAEAAQLLREKLSLSPQEDFFPEREMQDELGFTHTRYRQEYNGVPVAFGTYIIHAKNGAIKSFNGKYFDVSEVNTNPQLTPAQALAKAIAYVGASLYMWDSPDAALFDYQKPEGELVILPQLGKVSKTAPQAHLAYRFDIFAKEPMSRAIVYIDAHTGQFLYEDKIIHHLAPANGTAATRYSGSRTIQTDSYAGGYRLREYTRGNGIETYDLNNGTNYSSAVDFTDNDNNWTAAEYDNAAKDNAALDAHWGAEMTYDYWMSQHNRNSFDGNGAKIKSYVHYSTNYDNAYWNGSVMTYGDGSGTYFDALTSLDVAAHEIGHAVMSYTANLTYSYESGAMNEGFSDIWGASVEAYAAPNKQRWLIGEDIERRPGHAALRDMSNPKAEGQPDTYQGTNWYSGTADNGGVHTNSGVLNYWYYLVSEGGSGTNDNGDAYSVTGIGIDNAAKVAYRMISVYLTASSNYADARTAGIQSAVDLFGAGSAAEIAVTNAWYAVGIGAAYNGGGNNNYCSSKGNVVTDEYISRVQLNTIDNTSGANSGYSDFTSLSTDLAQGQSYTITVTPHWTGTVYNEAYSVWIDFNGDGDFADAGEQVWTKSPSKTSPVSGTFSVPASATTGTTRMRVSMKYNGIPTACETFSYGEVEDYTINITAGGGNNNYCSSKGNVVTDEYISRVQLNTIDNTSGANSGYSDFTSISTDLAQGQSYTITVTPHWTGTVYNEAYSVWIDFNGDGDFADAGEQVWTKSPSKTSPVSGTFSVPASATTGTTRMRVSMKYSGIPTACETFQYGEVEDYSVNITSGGGGGGGCVATTLSITLDNYPSETSWDIQDNAGNVVASGGTYGSQPKGSTLTIPNCLDPGCYTFTIYDSYGDGICCGYGNGSYSLTLDSDGSVLASGGSFNSSEATNFCLNAGAIAYTDFQNNRHQEALPDVQLFPNPVQSLLEVRLRDKRMTQYRIYNSIGQLVLSGTLDNNAVNVSALERGTYWIRFVSDKKQLTDRFVKE